ncbi:21127_t:CDS:2, partial [Gigaspora margarita]
LAGLPVQEFYEMKQELIGTEYLKKSETNTFISVTDEFHQALHIKFNKKLKTDPDVIALTDKDVSAGSLLLIIHELGIDLINLLMGRILEKVTLILLKKLCGDKQNKYNVL